jgi:hypothetical protein
MDSRQGSFSAIYESVEDMASLISKTTDKPDDLVALIYLIDFIALHIICLYLSIVDFG